MRGRARSTTVESGIAMPTAFDAAFGRAVLLCAGTLVPGAVLAFALVRRPAPDCRRPECRTHGNVTAPPLEGGR